MRSLDLRFRVTPESVTQEETEIMEAREYLNLWRTPQAGSRFVFLGPGLRSYDAKLERVGVENGTRYRGYANLIRLDGDSVLTRVTNVWRLFMTSAEVTAVRQWVLTRRQAGLRTSGEFSSWSSFTKYSLFEEDSRRFGSR